MRWETQSAPDIGALDRLRTIVVLPCGSLEQHGGHLPVGTDTVLATRVALAAAERLAAESRPVIVLPAPWYAYSPHHAAFPGTVTLRSETLIGLVKDIADSVLGQGFQHLLLLNGHGGNVAALDVAAADLGHRWHGRARIVAVTYFHLAARRAAEFRQSAKGGMGHAGEFETALMLHLAADTVHADAARSCYPDTGTPYLSTDLFAANAVRTYVDFADLSPTGVFGDPGLADADKGRRIFDICVEELAAVLRDFGTWPVAAAPAGEVRT